MLESSSDTLYTEMLVASDRTVCLRTYSTLLVVLAMRRFLCAPSSVRHHLSGPPPRKLSEKHSL